MKIFYINQEKTTEISLKTISKQCSKVGSKTYLLLPNVLVYNWDLAIIFGICFIFAVVYFVNLERERLGTKEDRMKEEIQRYKLYKQYQEMKEEQRNGGNIRCENAKVEVLKK